LKSSDRSGVCVRATRGRSGWEISDFISHPGVSSLALRAWKSMSVQLTLLLDLQGTENFSRIMAIFGLRRAFNTSEETNALDRIIERFELGGFDNYRVFDCISFFSLRVEFLFIEADNLF